MLNFHLAVDNTEKTATFVKSTNDTHAMNNYHILRMQYHGPTNHRGSRVTITSDRFNQRVTIPYDHQYKNAVEIAAVWLRKQGYNVIAQGEGPRWDYLITDTFEPLKK